MRRGVFALIGVVVCLLIVSGILHILDAEQTPAEPLADEILHALGVQDTLSFTQTMAAVRLRLPWARAMVFLD